MTPKIAFYAPMKSPNHPVPSGDRTIARGLMDVLGAIGEVELVSEFCSRDGGGDADRQKVLIRQVAEEVAGVIAQDKRWDAWVTYHNYYKAPDLVGPAVCAALNVPYYVVEASRSPKRRVGPWAEFARLADHASDFAQTIFYFTRRDLPELRKAKPVGQALVQLRPFLNRDDLPVPTSGSGKTLLSVGMFRVGDKVASYENLARALALIVDQDWTLRIVGGGDAEQDIRRLFEQFGGRVEFLGALDAAGVAVEMAAADVFVWPGVNEAFGMVYLEAQAAGLTVVAEDRVGVRDVIGPQGYLAEADNADALATAIDHALNGPWQVDAVRAYVSQFHLRGAAVSTFRGSLT